MSDAPKSNPNEVEHEAEIIPESGHGKMPLVLLGFWVFNISFFFYYFFRFGLEDLQQWLAR